ncbi:MAG TPA: L,D-transpeptidase [Solirubrobacteraceae bacterium]|nr:L,D-transpeptidase [Solirubrobacteraceae bacterium]
MRRAALFGALLFAAGCGGSAQTTTQAPRPTTPIAEQPAKPNGPGPGPFGAQLLRPVRLHTSPGGRVLARLATKTSFGSAQILAVARRRAGWLAVRTPLLPNGQVGWIREDARVRLLHEPWTLEVDLSRRRLIAHDGKRRAFSIPVAIGAPGTPTPTGKFGVTDRLRMSGTTYGCCALALSGNQPNIPQGWGGGTRIAIHGTTATGSIGTPASHGCIRASAEGMRRLMNVVPLGATVRIHA